MSSQKSLKTQYNILQDKLSTFELKIEQESKTIQSLQKALFEESGRVYQVMCLVEEQQRRIELLESFWLDDELEESQENSRKIKYSDKIEGIPDKKDNLNFIVDKNACNIDKQNKNDGKKEKIVKKVGKKNKIKYSNTRFSNRKKIMDNLVKPNNKIKNIIKNLDFKQSDQGETMDNLVLSSDDKDESMEDEILKILNNSIEDHQNYISNNEKDKLIEDKIENVLNESMEENPSNSSNIEYPEKNEIINFDIETNRKKTIELHKNQVNGIINKKHNKNIEKKIEKNVNQTSINDISNDESREIIEKEIEKIVHDTINFQKSKIKKDLLKKKDLPKRKSTLPDSDRSNLLSELNHSDSENTLQNIGKSLIELQNSILKEQKRFLEFRKKYKENDKILTSQLNDSFLDDKKLIYAIDDMILHNKKLLNGEVKDTKKNQEQLNDTTRLSLDKTQNNTDMAICNKNDTFHTLRTLEESDVISFSEGSDNYEYREIRDKMYAAPSFVTSDEEEELHDVVKNDALYDNSKSKLYKPQISFRNNKSYDKLSLHADYDLLDDTMRQDQQELLDAEVRNNRLMDTNFNNKENINKSFQEEEKKKRSSDKSHKNHEHNEELNTTVYTEKASFDKSNNDDEEEVLNSNVRNKRSFDNSIRKKNISPTHKKEKSMDDLNNTMYTEQASSGIDEEEEVLDDTMRRERPLDKSILKKRNRPSYKKEKHFDKSISKKHISTIYTEEGSFDMDDKKILDVFVKREKSNDHFYSPKEYLRPSYLKENRNSSCKKDRSHDNSYRKNEHTNPSYIKTKSYYLPFTSKETKNSFYHKQKIMDSHKPPTTMYIPPTSIDSRKTSSTSYNTLISFYTNEEEEEEYLDPTFRNERSKKKYYTVQQDHAYGSQNEFIKKSTKPSTQNTLQKRQTISHFSPRKSIDTFSKKQQIMDSLFPKNKPMHTPYKLIDDYFKGKSVYSKFQKGKKLLSQKYRKVNQKSVGTHIQKEKLMEQKKSNEITIDNTMVKDEHIEPLNPPPTKCIHTLSYSVNPIDKIIDPSKPIDPFSRQDLPLPPVITEKLNIPCSFHTLKLPTSIPEFSFSSIHHHDNILYFIPSCSNTIVTLDFYTTTFQEYPLPSKNNESYKFYGSCIHNDILYMAPDSCDNITLFHIYTHTIITVKIPSPISPCDAFRGVISIKDHVYFIPYLDQHLCIMSTEERDISTVQIQKDGFYQYHGGIALDNIIYLTPYDSDSIGMYDIEQNEYYTIYIGNQINGSSKFNSVIHTNHKLYYIPHSVHMIGVLDLDSHQFSTINLVDSSKECQFSGCLQVNNRIYISKFWSDGIVVMDIEEEIVTEGKLEVEVKGLQWNGSVMVEKIVYLLPKKGDSLGVVTL